MLNYESGRYVIQVSSEKQYSLCGLRWLYSNFYITVSSAGQGWP